jgi:hypothetical protein
MDDSLVTVVAGTAALMLILDAVLCLRKVGVLATHIT